MTRLVGGHEAEDLTQEVFLKVSRALDDFKGQSSISTWIYRIATNTALDRLRKPSFARPGERRMIGSTPPVEGMEVVAGELENCSGVESASA